MPEFLTYHEVQMREAARRRQARTGIVVLLALVAIGVFVPDRLSYAIGAFAVIGAGLLLNRAAR